MKEDKYVPFGELGLIIMSSFKKSGKKVNDEITEIRKTFPNALIKDSYIIPHEEIRFKNGEGKVTIQESVRGKDIYIISDVGNYGITYNMFGFSNHMSPDDHLQDLKRVVSAISGKARRVTVIMPLLYASRQHKRKRRESLDCSMALQELERLGVTDIITFDAHDPTIQNAVPLISFDNFYPTYQIMKTMVDGEKGMIIDQSKMLVISPDTGAMDRAIYYSGVLGLDIGMFYKRRDHSKVVGGKNPIVQHEYIGRDVEGLDILIVDDMIASGESVFDIAKELKRRKARNIYVSVTFGLFTEGAKKFNVLYEDGIINRVYSTNLTYIPKEVRNTPWFREVDVSSFIGEIIHLLNYDMSISPLMDGTESIKSFLARHKK